MAVATHVGPEAFPELHPHEFELISRLAYDQFGLDLRGGKQGLVAARLGKVMRDLGIKTFRNYYDYVMSDRSGAALSVMIDRLTTNHTSFFREPAHFDFLRKTIFPALRSRSRVDIWSAPCSTGEEPYSIAMSLLEEFPREAGAKVRIKANDISLRVLEKARRGIYEADRVSAIPKSMIQRYLTRNDQGPAPAFQFTSAVRSMIDFEHRNLVANPPLGYSCSVIFCRNMMIYFDRPTQQRFIERLIENLEAGGYLLIGHSESLNQIAHGLEYICPATYRKPARVSAGQKGRG